MKNGEISPIYEHIAWKYIDLITLGGGLLENKHVPYEGLVIETSNCTTQHVFLQNPTTVTKHKHFEAKYKYQNTNIYMDFSKILPKPLH